MIMSDAVYIREIALFPILAIVVLAVIAVGLVLLAMAFKSPHRKLLLLLPAGATVLAVLAAGVILAFRTYSVESLAMAEQHRSDQAEAALRAAREEYQTAYQSQVLDYRGDSTEPLVVDPVTTGGGATIEIFRYSPSGQQGDESLSQLPTWVDDPGTMIPTSANQSFVLSSEPWSSVEEADEELYALLSVHLGEYLRSAYPEAEGWQPTRTSLETMPLIQDSVRENVPLEVGEHTVHVQHAYWQVQLTPEIREDLYSQWRPVIVQERLIHLGGGLGFMTLLFAMAAGIFRLRRRPRGSGRHTAAVVAAIIFLLAGLSTLFLA